MKRIFKIKNGRPVSAIEERQQAIDEQRTNRLRREIGLDRHSAAQIVRQNRNIPIGQLIQHISRIKR